MLRSAVLMIAEWPQKFIGAFCTASPSQAASEGKIRQGRFMFNKKGVGGGIDIASGHGRREKNGRGQACDYRSEQQPLYAFDGVGARKK